MGMTVAHFQNRQAPRKREHALMLLPEEDRDFVVQFVLASGSLKEMAMLHQVSYPTIRATLDRVILKLRQTLAGMPPDPMTELLANLVERGEIKVSTANNIRDLYRKALEQTMLREEQP